ncbi:hypothetical protein RQP50_22815 [Paenibacillus sp. chi10]|uniref:DUF4083 domain-containing protein n=1 Tax=Paenibacillus suaedae TaxID=3077233 RepID=A0AAJ2JYZ5_9BACL|nr:hypothetical protein [Paenibacillus sp. chi10]MDT8979076.1 hypothetical protein [Paenibacillus sp. chi10]
MSFVWENIVGGILFLLVLVALIVGAVLLIVRSKKRASQLHVRIEKLEHQVNELQGHLANKQR